MFYLPNRKAKFGCIAKNHIFAPAMKLSGIFREDTRYKALFLSILMSAIGYGLYKAVIDNYLAEIVGMGEMGRGVAEFFREVPGLLLVLIMAICYKASAERMYKAGVVIMFLGMALQACISPSKALVIMVIFFYSTGEHIQLAMRSTLPLQYSRQGCGGQALGHQSAIYQIGNLAGYAAVIAVIAIMGRKGLTAGMSGTDSRLFRPVFIASALFMMLAMAVAFRLTANSQRRHEGSRFYFRRKFRKYYMLEVFYGARKQVFFTFGPYVLILFYGADAGMISMLFAISAVACFFISPLVGKLIDRIGYKPVMIGDTLILVIVCFFYGFAHHIFSMHTAFIVCCVNYVLDSIISLASMASNVYVQDIADSQEEMRKTISTGISVNHMITVLIALLGGWIWKTLGIETLFILSAVLGLCNSAYAATIRTASARKC